MKVSDAVKFLEQLDGDSDVTITFEQGIKLKPGTPPAQTINFPYINNPYPTYVPPQWGPNTYPNYVWCSSSTEYKQ